MTWGRSKEKPCLEVLPHSLLQQGLRERTELRITCARAHPRCDHKACGAVRSAGTDRP